MVTAGKAGLEPVGRRRAAAAPPQGRAVRGSKPFLTDGYPHLAAQWHPTGNCALTPDQVRGGFTGKVWWRCPAGTEQWPHDYLASVEHRTRGTGCPFCAGKRASPENSLARLLPGVAVQWHPINNGDLSPADVTPGSSGFKVWWHCPAGDVTDEAGRRQPGRWPHDWQTTVASRANGAGCPYCDGKKTLFPDSLAGRHPDLAAEWDPVRTGRAADTVAPGASWRAWWTCPAGHSYERRVEQRVRGFGCPFCSGRRATPATSLAALHPHLAAQWHPTRNTGLTPDQVRPGRTTGKVWWVCGLGHEWDATVNSRTKTGGSGCPTCASHTKKGVPLAAKAPELLAEWDDHLNGGPGDQVMAGSKYRAWWRCATDPTHLWRTSVANRVRLRTRCAYCLGQRPTPGNNLAVTHPALAAQWHPDDNGDLSPTDVLGGRSEPVAWLCPAGHAWATAPALRTRQASGCPYCEGNLPSHGNTLADTDPMLAVQWHPTRNPGLTPDQVTPMAAVAVWWQCPHCDHTWWAKVGVRAAGGTDCPACFDRRCRTGQRGQLAAAAQLLTAGHTRQDVQQRTGLSARRLDRVLPPGTPPSQPDPVQPDGSGPAESRQREPAPLPRGDGLCANGR